MKSKAHELWDIYYKAVGGVSHNGHPLPKWIDLDERGKDGWRAVAEYKLNKDE